jgi:hypothetical protein
LKHIDKVSLGRQLVAGFEAAIQDCRLDLIDKVLKDAIVLCFSKHGLLAPQMPFEDVILWRCYRGFSILEITDNPSG